MKKKTALEKELEGALNKIARSGMGVREEARDWAQIGRNSVMTARNVLSGRCKACGRSKEFK